MQSVMQVQICYYAQIQQIEFAFEVPSSPSRYVWLYICVYKYIYIQYTYVCVCYKASTKCILQFVAI